MRRHLCVLLVACLIAPAVPPALAAQDVPGAIAHGLDHLRAEQDADGSIAGSPMLTQWAVTTVAGAGEDPRTWRTAPDAPSLLDAVASQYAQLDLTKAGDWARAILAIVAAGEDPRTFGGHDWLGNLRLHHVSNQTGNPAYVNDDLFAVLALRAAGVPATDAQVADGVRELREGQYADGSWGYAKRDPGATGHSPDLTGMALCALRVAGAATGDDAILLGLDFLDAVQLDDGSFPMAPGGSQGNPWSTAWVVPGLRCAGEDTGAARWTPGGTSAVDWLANRTLEETDTWAMIEIVRALAYPSFPVHPPPPVADLTTASASVGRNDAVGFDASGSTDPWNGGLSYRWDFGDGSGLDWGAHPQVEHAFREPGTYVVTVEVQSEKTGARAAAPLTLEVYNRAPSLTLPSGLDANRVEAAPWENASAADADGDTLTWSWDFGDGVTAVCDAAGCRYHGGAADGTTSAGSIPTHRYAELGNYTVAVTVEDGYGAVDNGTFNATVHNLPPATAIRSLTFLQGLGPHPFNVYAEDPDGMVTRAAWQFGDGGNATCDSTSCIHGDGTVEAGSGDGLTQPTHTFPEDGTYVVAVTVEDSDGATVTTNRSFVVDSLPPETRAIPERAPGPHGWYAKPVNVTLEATDASGSVASTVFRVDQGPSQAYTSPVHLAGDGVVNLTYWSWDRARNREASQTLEVPLDVSPPTVGFDTLAGFLVVNPRDPVEAFAQDTASGVRHVRFLVDGTLVAVDEDGRDGWSFHPGDSGVPAGIREFHAVAVDAAGHAGHARATAFVLPTGFGGPD